MAVSLTVHSVVVTVGILGEPDPIALRLQLNSDSIRDILPWQMFQWGPEWIGVCQPGEFQLLLLVVRMVLKDVWSARSGRPHPFLFRCLECQNEQPLPLEFAGEVARGVRRLDKVLLRDKNLKNPGESLLYSLLYDLERDGVSICQGHSHWRRPLPSHSWC